MLQRHRRKKNEASNDRHFILAAASTSIDDMPTAAVTTNPPPLPPPQTLTKHHRVDLGDYLRYFRDATFPEEEINYSKIMPLWNSLDNIDNLAVGSTLQRSDAKDSFPFISHLYTEAKRCFVEHNNFRQAKVLVLTAGLFEQCRLSEVSSVTQFFGQSSTTAFDEMEQVLPFMHRAHIKTLSKDVLESYLPNFDWKKRREEISRREPVVQINLQNKDDYLLRRISLNPLTLFKYLPNRLGNDTNQEIPDESLRISLRRNGKLISVTFFPYAKERSLAILRIKSNDSLTVGEFECDSNSVDKFSLPFSNSCFDISLKHWMPVTFNCLHELTKMVPDGLNQPLLQAVASFWSEPSTGRLNFLCADTQMVCTFSALEGRVSYIRQCYENGQHYFHEGRKLGVGWHNTAKGYLLTAALMEQGQFTPIRELLELYSTHQTIDEELMSKNHPWIHCVYAAIKSQDALGCYFNNLDIEALKTKVRIRSLCISLRFYHVQSKNYHMIRVNPLVTLETLLSIHTNVSKFSYQYIGVTTDEGRVINFGQSRKKTLLHLGIQNQSVLLLEDLKLRPNTVLEPPRKDFVKEFSEMITNLVNHHVKDSLGMLKPAIRQQLGENGSILFVISRYFLKTAELMRIISADEMDKFEGRSPYDNLYQMAMEFLEEGAFFEAQAVVLATAFIEQCQITGVHDAVAYISSDLYLSPITTLREKLEKPMPICYNCCVVVEKPVALMNYLQELDIYKHRNELRGKEPRINLVFSNRDHGIDQSCMTNVNSNMSFHHFVKKYAVHKHGKSLDSLRIGYNGRIVFITTIGKKTLRQLGMKDNDILIVEDIAPTNSSTKNLNNGQRRGSTNPKKKKKGGAKQKNKPRKQIIIPKTVEELKREHSGMMSRVLEQLEHEKLRKIRLKLNNLSIKKMSAKKRKPVSIKIDSNPVVNPPTEGLGGKAGKVVFPVVVGNSEHLYKSSKKSSIVQRNQKVCAIDLHGCAADEAIGKLNDKLPIWIDAAMKEETFTIPVDIVCGAGNQILSEVVEQWIWKNRHVANRPKGFI